MSSSPPYAETESAVSRSSDRLYRCDAIVLARMDFGEADRILTLYSRQHGKLRVIAKGARRPLSRLGPHLEYFSHSRLMLARGRDLDVVTGAETVEAHLAIRDDLDAFGNASHMVEILARLTEDRQENAAVFDLLASSLHLLADGVDAFHVTRHYELALLTLLGYRPQLLHCIECRVALSQAPHPFSPAQGGFLCESCHGRAPATRLVGVDAQKYLRALDRGGLSATVRISIDSPLRDELEGIFGAYLRHIAERDLGSLRVLRELHDASSYNVR
ncbi:MAG: DNA repair protein RecO [Chloroflexota bacterium]|nr:DNA repair protein RecO [Chloroflexia bacterium]MDQ3226723.1 DNA repair protein RecO [Chloroflexota bacterium]